MNRERTTKSYAEFGTVCEECVLAQVAWNMETPFMFLLNKERGCKNEQIPIMHRVL